MDDREYLQLQIEIKKHFSKNKLSSIWLQTQRNTRIDVQITFSSDFRGEIFLLFLSKLTHDAGIYVSKEILISKKEKIKTNQQRKNKQQTKQKIFTQCAWERHQAKYLFRAWPFTRKVSVCPSKFCNQKELGPNFSTIKNGPNHKF
jgi:hypothetical protein